MKPFPWDSRLLPTVTTAGRFPLLQHDFTNKYQAATHAIHIHQYAGQIRLGEALLSLRPGDLTITSAGIPSWYALPKPGHHWCIHFTPARITTNKFRLPMHTSLGASASHAGEKIMAIGRLLSDQSLLSSAAASAAALELLLWLSLQNTRGQSGRSPTRGQLAAERAAEIMQAEFTSPLYTSDLASRVGMTQNHLARMFKHRFTVTIQRYLIDRRLNAARHLLRTTNISIAGIGTRVGIDDPQYFNKLFRRIAGQSPARYRIAEANRRLAVERRRR